MNTQISSTEWGCFKVADFFSLCSWEGAQNKSLKTDPQKVNWSCQSVKEFFEQGNWQGLLLEKSSNKTLENPLSLPVFEFFELVNWDREPIVAAVAELNALMPTIVEHNFTLDDLSDLF